MNAFINALGYKTPNVDFVSSVAFHC